MRYIKLIIDLYPLWQTLFYVAAGLCIGMTISLHLNSTTFNWIRAQIVFWSAIFATILGALLIGIFVARMLHFSVGILAMSIILWKFYKQGVYEVQSSVPEAALLTVRNIFVNMLRMPGKRFFPYRGFLTGPVPIAIGIVERDLETHNDKGTNKDGKKVVSFILKNGVGGEAPIAITIKPNTSTELVNDAQGNKVLNLINYLFTKKEDGFFDQFGDKCIRAFQDVMSLVEDEDAALRARNTLVIAILKEVAGHDIVSRIPSSVRTSQLMKRFWYDPTPFSPDDFSDRDLIQMGIKDTEGNADRCFDDLALLREKAEAFIDLKIQEDEKGAEGRNLRQKGIRNYRKHLRESLKQRQDVLLQLERGDGGIPVPSHGVIVMSAVIGEMKFSGKVREAREKEVIEEYKRSAQRKETANYMETMQKLVDAGMSPETAGDRALVLLDQMPDGAYMRINVDLTTDAQSMQLVQSVGGTPAAQSVLQQAATNVVRNRITGGAKGKGAKGGKVK